MFWWPSDLARQDCQFWNWCYTLGVRMRDYALQHLGLRRKPLERPAGPYRMLSGDPVGTKHDDALQHEAVALSLAAAIRDTPWESSLGIALYGPWGQGKSTIGRLLKEELRAEIEVERRYVYVKIETWKYATEGDKQPLRRHFLVAAYTAAGFARKARRLKRLFSGEFSGPMLGTASSPVSARAIILGFFVTFVTLGAAGLFFPHLFHSHLVGEGGHALAVVGVAGALLTLGVERVFVRARFDPFRSIEEFEDALDHLLAHEARSADRRPVERFIFFVDDLDRCHDSVVVEAIETLQTLFSRPRCVYIVAADRDQLKRAVREKAAAPASPLGGGQNLYDESFLEKIFQVSIDVPPPLDDILVEYARELLREWKPSIKSEDRETLLYYLIHSDVRSPRQVRVILNEYKLAFANAHEREEQERTHLTHRPITRQPLLLAKFVVLRAHFPWFYELLTPEPDLLLDAQVYADNLTMAGHVDSTLEKPWNDRVRPAALRAAEEQLRFARDDLPDEDSQKRDLVNERATFLLADLADYLARTSSASVADPVQVEEFILLRGRPEFEKLTGSLGRSVRAAIESGNVQRLQELLGPSQPEHLISSALELACTRLPKARSDAERNNVRKALLALIPLADVETLESFGDKAREALYEHETWHLDERIRGDDAEGVARLVPYLELDELRTFVSQHPLIAARYASTIGARSVALNDESAWLSLLESARLDLARLKSLEEEVSKLTGSVATSLVDGTLVALAPVLCAPRDRRTEELEFDGWDPDAVAATFIEPNGDTVTFDAPGAQLASALGGLALGQSVRAEAVCNRDRWVLAEFSVPPGDPVQSDPPFFLAERDLISQATAVARGVLETADKRSVDYVRILDWPFADNTELVGWVQFVVSLLRKNTLRPDSILLKVMLRVIGDLTGDSLSPDEAVTALAVLLPRVDTSELRTHRDEALRTLITAVQLADVRQCRILADRLHTRSVRSAFPSTTLRQAWHKQAPDDVLERVKLIEYVFAPIDIEEAARVIVTDIRNFAPAADAPIPTDREERRVLIEQLGTYGRLLATVAGQSTARGVSAEVHRAPMLRFSLIYAASLMGLYVKHGPPAETMPEAFMSAAARASHSGLDDLVRVLNGRDDDPAVNAVLAGVGVRGMTVSAAEFLSKARSRVPEIDQIGRIASIVSRQAARRLTTQNPIEALFSATDASLSHDVGRAEELLAYLGAWKNARPKQRETIGHGFAKLFDRAKTEQELALILQQALAFFDTDQGVSGKVRLRTSGFAAIKRVYYQRNKWSLPSDVVTSLIEQAMTSLGWTGTLAAPAPQWLHRLMSRANAAHESSA